MWQMVRFSLIGFDGEGELPSSTIFVLAFNFQGNQKLFDVAGFY